MKKNIKKLYIRGFSVIELVVVLSIFAIISSVSVFNYRGYESRINRVNTAQDIALSIRQAQVYGLSASGRDLGAADFDTGSTADDFFSGSGSAVPDILTDRSVRGVNLDPEAKKIRLFEDNFQDYKYTSSSTDRIIDERVVVSSNIYLVGCLYVSGVGIDLDECPTEVNGEVNITFQRPYPDAVIEYNSSPYATLVIHVLDDPDADLADSDVIIQVDPAGQIFVHNI